MDVQKGFQLHFLLLSCWWLESISNSLRKKTDKMVIWRDQSLLYSLPWEEDSRKNAAVEKEGTWHTFAQLLSLDFSITKRGCSNSEVWGRITSNSERKVQTVVLQALLDNQFGDSKWGETLQFYIVKVKNYTGRSPSADCLRKNVAGHIKGQTSRNHLIALPNPLGSYFKGKHHTNRTNIPVSPIPIPQSYSAFYLCDIDFTIIFQRCH